MRYFDLLEETKHKNVPYLDHPHFGLEFQSLGNTFSLILVLPVQLSQGDPIVLFLWLDFAETMSAPASVAGLRYPAGIIYNHIIKKINLLITPRITQEQLH